MSLVGEALVLSHSLGRSHVVVFIGGCRDPVHSSGSGSACCVGISVSIIHQCSEGTSAPSDWHDDASGRISGRWNYRHNSQGRSHQLQELDFVSDLSPGILTENPHPSLAPRAPRKRVVVYVQATGHEPLALNGKAYPLQFHGDCKSRMHGSGPETDSRLAQPVTPVHSRIKHLDAVCLSLAVKSAVCGRLLSAVKNTIQHPASFHEPHAPNKSHLVHDEITTIPGYDDPRRLPHVDPRLAAFSAPCLMREMQF